MTNFETWVIGSDIHFKHENKAAVNCFLETIDLVKPTGIILNGDIMNCGSFSRHEIFNKPKCHWTDDQFFEDSEHEYWVLNNFLDKIDEIAPKSQKIWNDGNHEMWLNEFIKQSPKTREDKFGLDNRLGLIDRGYERNKYRKLVSLGKLRVTHTLFDRGGAGTQNHSKKHVETMGKSILYGHYHDIQSFSKITPEHVTHMAWSVGCLCDMNPDYLRNGPQNWSHGFAIVYVFPNGYFQVDQKVITKGKVIVNGKLIDGNLKKYWRY